MSDSKTADLLPCPFCGGAAHTSDYKDDFENYVRGVGCSSCRAEITYRADAYPCDTEADTEARDAAMIEAWNRRAAAPQPASDVSQDVVVAPIHADDCEYHCDQYSFECTCGAIPASETPAAESAEPVLIEEIAKWLHDETDHPDSYPDSTWPETDRDDGQRDGGFVKIVPAHAQAYFREIAGRLVRGFRLAAPPDTALAEARAEIERLRKALEFYADPEIYRCHPSGLAFDDRDKSYHARDALRARSEPKP